MVATPQDTPCSAPIWRLADLVAGTPSRLRMPDDPGELYRFHAIHCRATPPGPGAAWLRDRLVETGEASMPGSEARGITVRYY